jgi:hypothetical protein
VVAVAKARQLEASGYQVRITDRMGRQFMPSEFDELLHSKSRASLPARDFIPAWWSAKTAREGLAIACSGSGWRGGSVGRDGGDEGTNCGKPDLACHNFPQPLKSPHIMIA